MIKINVVAVGKVKEKYYAEGIAEYVKRIGKYAKINVIEVQEENYQEVNSAIINKIKKTEGERIAPYLKGEIISLAIEGEKLNSVKFSELIKKNVDNGKEITFVIGGSYGLSDEIKSRSKLLSFSDMTFPHTLFRLILTEQIYRAFTIINNSTYHK